MNRQQTTPRRKAREEELEEQADTTPDVSELLEEVDDLLRDIEDATGIVDLGDLLSEASSEFQQIVEWRGCGTYACAEGAIAALVMRRRSR